MLWGMGVCDSVAQDVVFGVGQEEGWLLLENSQEANTQFSNSPGFLSSLTGGIEIVLSLELSWQGQTFLHKAEIWLFQAGDTGHESIGRLQGVFQAGEGSPPLGTGSLSYHSQQACGMTDTCGHKQLPYGGILASAGTQPHYS